MTKQKKYLHEKDLLYSDENHIYLTPPEMVAFFI